MSNERDKGGHPTLNVDTPSPFYVGRGVDESDSGEIPLRDRGTDAAPPPEPLNIGRQACLVVLSGLGEGDTFPLERGRTYTIGRGDAADIRLEDDGASRIHASIQVDGNTATLEDEGSRNGTFVGGQLIERRALAEEDLISVGSGTVMKFCFIDEIDQRLRQRMRSAAMKDPLTNVYNRRHFDERLAAECAAARRHSRPLSLLLIDIDDFKVINDQFGHPVGDRVLCGVAKKIQQAIRSEDLLCRYGGEEFAVLARETTLAGALRLGDRLRDGVNAARFEVPFAKVDRLCVNVSVGVAELGDAPDDQSLIDQADNALYAAKREGKNRTFAASRGSQ